MFAGTTRHVERILVHTHRQLALLLHTPSERLLNPVNRNAPTGVLQQQHFHQVFKAVGVLVRGFYLPLIERVEHHALEPSLSSRTVDPVTRLDRVGQRHAVQNYHSQPETVGSCEVYIQSFLSL